MMSYIYPMIPLAGWFKIAHFFGNAILNFISMCNKKKSLWLVSFRRCARHAQPTSRDERFTSNGIKIGIKNHFGKFFATIEPYDCHIRLWWCWNTKYIHTYVYSISLSVSHFSSISYSLRFSLLLLFYERVCVQMIFFSSVHWSS